MQIFIKIDKTIIIDIEPDSLISDVCSKIQDKIAYPSQTFYLNYRGKALDSAKTLYDYNIGKESTLHLAFRIDLNSLNINIKYLEDKTISLKVRPYDCINDVKQMISKTIGYRPDQQTLFFNENQLNDEAVLCFYGSSGIKSESTLNLVLSVITINFKILATGKKIKRRFEKNASIADIKNEIMRLEAPLNILRLVCKGITLMDDQSLSHYEIDHKSTISVIQLIENDVSHFTNQELDTFLNDFLKMNDTKDLEERTPHQALDEKATRANANVFEEDDDYNDEIDTNAKNGVLLDEHIAILNNLCCFARMECLEPTSNIRIKLSDEMFNLLFDNDLELLQGLKKLSICESMVLISVMNDHVSFGMDDYDQERNVHISLNTPDSGGVMLLFCTGKLVPIVPITGSLTTYNPTILCGLTKVQGICNSLVIVNEASRWFRYEDKCHVFEVDQTLIERYNRREETWNLKLALHLREKKDLKERCLRCDREEQDSKKRIRELKAENVLLRGVEGNTNNMNLGELANAKKRAKSRLDDIEDREQYLMHAAEIEKMCIICKVEPKTTLLMPCRHFALCKTCSSNPLLEDCPLCREYIDSKIEVFL